MIFFVVIKSKYKRTTLSTVVDITCETTGEDYNIECIFYSNGDTEMKMGPRRRKK